MERTEKQKGKNVGSKRVRLSASERRLLKLKRLFKTHILHILNPKTKFGVAFIAAVASVLGTKGVEAFFQDGRQEHRPPRHEQVHKPGKDNMMQFLQVFHEMMANGSLSKPCQEADVLMCPDCSHVVLAPTNQAMTVTCNDCRKAYQKVVLEAKVNEGRAD